MKPTVDYSLYLVTDSTRAVLGDANLIDVVEKALMGGVTIVQYREKNADTGEQVSIACKLHAVTQKYNVPLLINDRVDVALAIGCEGVHIGQDDIDLKTARKLLGEDATIGVTVSSIEEALKACEDGADYLGIGTIFATPTKANAKDIIGTAGCQAILQAMADNGYGNVSTVCIGGQSAKNVSRVMYQTKSEKKGLNGVALVSAIVSAKDPEAAARDLLHRVHSPPPFAYEQHRRISTASYDEEQESLIKGVAEVVARIKKVGPLSHNMTNLVVQNFAANVALAIGASPIMASSGHEAADLAKNDGALVINMGTVTDEGLQNYLLALRAYNENGGPVVFDPVGAAATALRRRAVKVLMDGGYFDVIKGNESEICQVYGQTEVKQRGVDGAGKLKFSAKAKLVRDLARRERNVVVMTGPTDFVSDGELTYMIENGHEYLERITGSGCVLGTVISAALAGWKREDKLMAAVAALMLFEIAGERAARRPEVRGPGTFVPALIDELALITEQKDDSWLRASAELKGMVIGRVVFDCSSTFVVWNDIHHILK